MCQKLKCLNLSISNVVHANGYYKTIPKVICRVGIRKKITTWAVFMAQLVELSLSNQEGLGSNPAIKPSSEGRNGHSKLKENDKNILYCSMNWVAVGTNR